MRVCGGELRGRRFRGPGQLRVRPTGDKLREAIFNILGERVEGRVVLDLFAGVGGLGIEALSRGARKAVFVESDPRAGKVLRGNLAGLDLQIRSRVIIQDVYRALKGLEKRRENFNLVFLDPPYDQGFSEPVLTWLSRSVILSPEAEVVLEHGPKEKTKSNYGTLSRWLEKKYDSKGVAGFRVVP